MTEQVGTFVPTNKAMRDEAMSELLVSLHLQMDHLRPLIEFLESRGDERLEWFKTRLACLERLNTQSSFLHELEPVLLKIFPEDGDEN